MKIKTSELKNLKLDWAVATAEKVDVVLHDDGITRCIMRDNGVNGYAGRFNPSSNWLQSGPIIEREKISFAFEPSMVYDDDCRWKAICAMSDREHEYGQTPLIAAMRCYVAFKLGNEVDIPDELV